MLLETVMIVLAVTAAAAVRLGAAEGLTVLTTVGGLLRAGVVASICQLCLFFADMYDLRLVADRRELFVRLLRSPAATTTPERSWSPRSTDRRWPRPARPARS